MNIITSDSAMDLTVTYSPRLGTFSATFSATFNKNTTTNKSIVTGASAMNIQTDGDASSIALNSKNINVQVEN